MTADAPSSRSPTILQILPALHSGGVERGTADIARAVVQAGWRSLVASSGGALVERIEAEGSQHITLPLNTKNPLSLWRNAARIGELIDKEQVDILHARSRGPAWSGWHAAQTHPSCRFITTFHGAYRFRSRLKRAYNSVMARGELVIAVSDFIAGHIIEHYGLSPDNIRVIPRGVDLAHFDPAALSQEVMQELAEQWGMTPDVPVVLAPGRIARGKGHDWMIEALATLKRRDFLVVFLGVGNPRSSYYQEVDRLLAQHGLTECVRFAPPTPHMPEALSLARVVVMPSVREEAFGRVAVEAQAMKCPVIAINHGGASETILHEETGWLVSPRRAELAAAVQHALDLPERDRRTMGEQARRHVADRFSLEQMCAYTLGTYEELLAMRAVGG